MANSSAFRSILSSGLASPQPASNLHLVSPESKHPPLQLSIFKFLFPKGLKRGTLVEATGRRSTGRTTIALHVLAQATARGEVCAFIDTHDTFHPDSAQAAGVQLDRIVWVRCRGNAEHALRATDLILHAGGFGVVLLDLCDAPPRVLNRIPLSYWYRFRRTVENTPAILLVCGSLPQPSSCFFRSLELTSTELDWQGQSQDSPSMLLCGLRIAARLSRMAGAVREYLFIPAKA